MANYLHLMVTLSISRDAVTKEKVLCEMLAIKAEATNGDLLAVENEALKADMRAMEDSIVEHESALRYLLNKEAEANAKDKSLSMEKQERNRRLDEEENYRSRNKKALRFQPFRLEPYQILFLANVCCS